MVIYFYLVKSYTFLPLTSFPSLLVFLTVFFAGITYSLRSVVSVFLEVLDAGLGTSATGAFLIKTLVVFPATALWTGRSMTTVCLWAALISAREAEKRATELSMLAMIVWLLEALGFVGCLVGR
ncbi:hypothetical protein FR483_N211L [Paramecium bursaria Chlorella virus FR483]|uniref:Uncharacterized protein N211L n=1 Tax=Paramecium bursaria Chlorella virus FR483 TaxID=399781 RepID=A7J6R5_PBCVF|nr:hypothetical protein FR483_N211L [Paramecium bursaria Chlorella virus FR483]ABT15496.1 hypothetical protein FR483_N211L [Paramecium bursaria Chlorella virus FR483]